ncbi:hypothetical protein METHP14_20081 [Pseudomonas sp. P14-2025]
MAGEAGMIAMNGLIEAELEGDVGSAGPFAGKPAPTQIPVGAGAPAKGPRQEMEISITPVTSFLHIAPSIFYHPPPAAGRTPARQL